MDINFRNNNKRLAISALFGMIMILVACTTPETPTPAPVPECPTWTVPTPVSYDVLWASSAHADGTAEAFTHWDETDPREIPVDCAQCHSRTGFLDFLGVDGTQVGMVDGPAKTGSVITCYVCHNEAVLTMDFVNFNSGRRIGGLGPEARCIDCHQGRAATNMVINEITGSNLPNDDTPSADLLFIDNHFSSGATPFGSEAQAAFEYAGMSYQNRFMRGEDFFSCIQCHDQHTLELKVGYCSDCHTFDGTELKNIRVNTTDFDGDGDITEGAFFEIEQMNSNLLSAIQAYAKNIVGVPIVYNLVTYPYFFVDTNDNGIPDTDETTLGNSYKSWTPRLLRAAYNLHYVSHDAGAFAHNSKYVLQVLYDSLLDISGDTTGLARP